jgi:hypothetical protein
MLFALLINTMQAQTVQGPAAGSVNNNSDFILPSAMPEGSDLLGVTHQKDKLTMISSPNPFSSRTVITCDFPSQGKAELGIRNMFGESVNTFITTVEQEGPMTFEVNSEHMRPGVYTALLVFKTGEDMLIKTIRLVYTK